MKIKPLIRKQKQMTNNKYFNNDLNSHYEQLSQKVCKVLVVSFLKLYQKLNSNLLYHLQLKAWLFLFLSKKAQRFSLYSKVPLWKRIPWINWGVQISVKNEYRSSTKKQYGEKKRLNTAIQILDMIQCWLKIAEKSTLWTPSFPFHLRRKKLFLFKYVTESSLSQSTWFIAQIPKSLTDLWSIINLGYSFYPFICLLQ